MTCFLKRSWIRPLILAGGLICLTARTAEVSTADAALERLKKNCSRSERGFLGFGEALVKEQVPSNPVTEPKQSQNPKRPPSPLPIPNGYSFSENALASQILQDKRLDMVESNALQLLKGFNAGTSYGEIWIRDFNTFINGSFQVHSL